MSKTGLKLGLASVTAAAAATAALGTKKIIDKKNQKKMSIAIQNVANTKRTPKVLCTQMEIMKLLLDQKNQRE